MEYWTRNEVYSCSQRKDAWDKKFNCLLHLFILWGENILVRGLMWRWGSSLRGGQFSFPPCESVNKHLYQPGHLTGSRKIFFFKKNNLYFKKDRKDKEKTKQNTSGGLLTPAFAPPPWQSHASYSEAHCCAFLHDVCDDGLAYPFPDGTLDVVLLVFVLSSIHPDR